jgi:hypothetical protein
VANLSKRRLRSESRARRNGTSLITGTFTETSHRDTEMGLLSPLAAAFYCHPVLTLSSSSVPIAVVYTTMRRLR